MPSDQIKAEITIVFKGKLSDDLGTQMASFFVGQGANVAQCAANTSVAGANFLSLAVFARAWQNLVFLYLKEDVHTLKIHLESVQATSLDSLNHDRDQFQQRVVAEVGKMERFSKLFKYKMDTIAVVVSLNDFEISTAQQNPFKKRLAAGLKAPALVAKAGGIIGTGVAGYLLQMDPAGAGKGMLAGLLAIVVATLAEAGLGDALKFHRS